MLILVVNILAHEPLSALRRSWILIRIICIFALGHVQQQIPYSLSFPLYRQSKSNHLLISTNLILLTHSLSIIFLIFPYLSLYYLILPYTTLYLLIFLIFPYIPYIYLYSLYLLIFLIFTYIPYTSLYSIYFHILPYISLYSIYLHVLLKFLILPAVPVLLYCVDLRII